MDEPPLLFAFGNAITASVLEEPDSEPGLPHKGRGAVG